MAATVLVVTGRSSLTAILAVEATTAGAPTMGLTGELGAVATAAAEATRIATSPARHVTASTLARKSKNYDARRPPRQATTTASLPSLRDFAPYSSQRNSSLWELPSTT
jgi:microcompartment protein CcmL/EutN